MNTDEIELVLFEHKQNLQMEKINGMDATDNTRYFENFQMEKKAWEPVMRIEKLKVDVSTGFCQRRNNRLLVVVG